MRVLITGGGGFIGSHLVESQLNQGHWVRTIDLHFEQLAHLTNHPQLEMIERSLTTEQDFLAQLMEGIDVVYHLASAHLDVTLPEAYYEKINIEVTKELVQAASTAGAKRFVHCSTNSVIGQITHPPVDETTPCHPTNIYEKTKLAGEQAVLAYHQATDFPVVVIRPSWVYGARCPRTAKLFRTVRKGRFIMFGDGQTLRHPIYITDMLKGFELAAVHENAVGKVYFIAGETAVTIAELMAQIANVQKVSPPRLRFPLWLGETAGYVVEHSFKLIGRQPPISSRTLDFYTKHNAYDISKACQELGFRPQVDLQTGLALTLDTL